MAKWVVLVETTCSDPSRLNEFNEWYNKIHLPDVLETPGLFRATRYENVSQENDQAPFLAAYEVESDDLQATIEASNQNLAKKAEEGRMSELMQIVSLKSYRQLYTVSD